MIEKIKTMKKEHPFSLFLLAIVYPGIVVVFLADWPYIAGLFGEQAGK